MPWRRASLLAAISFAAGSLSADVVLLSDNFDWPTGVTEAGVTDIRAKYVQGGTLVSTKQYGGQNALKYYGTAEDGYVGYYSIGANSRRNYISFNESDLPEGYTAFTYTLSITTKNSSTAQFGFSSHVSSSVYDTADSLTVVGTLWFNSVYNSGTDTTAYTLYYGTSSVITTGSYAGGDLAAYSISYDFATNTILEASIGETIVVNDYDLDDVSYTPSIQALQFQFGSLNSNAILYLADDLLVTAIPESQTVLLMFPSVLLLAVAWRKRRR